MTLSAHHEKLPRWDAAKARALGSVPPGSLPPMAYREGDLLPGEWWRIQDGDAVVGYGWMDLSWGEAEILLAVDAEAQGKGAGRFILDTLAHETAARGCQYMFNTVRPGHPNAARLSAWLRSRGFEPAGDGTLRRRVRPSP